MIVEIIFIIIGILFLCVGADMLVDAVVRISDKLKVNKLLVTLFIVCIGTSVPEIIITLNGTLNQSEIALSNIVGSNISNLMVIFSLSLFAGEVKLNKLTKNETLKMFLVETVFLLLCLYLRELNYITGIFFIVMLIYHIVTILKSGNAIKEEQDIEEADSIVFKFCNKIIKNKGIIVVAFVILGLLLLYHGGNMVVDNSIILARMLNISESIIGVSILAVGTSLPELITSIVSIRKKHYDIVTGNIIGSNIINTCLVLLIPAFMTTIQIGVVEIVQLLMMFISVSIFTLFVLKEEKLNYKHGLVFIFIYIISVIIMYNFN